MKSFYNAIKKPVTHYLKKSKEGIKGLDTLTQKIKTLEIEDQINFSSNRELYLEQIFAYKPSIFRQKINDDFNYADRFNLNYSNQFGIKKIGLSYVLNRQFSTKVVTVNNPKPRIHSGGDFGKLVKESSIFVDKSLFIKEILEDSSEAILITMPRRWGKSLNLDMLKRFLSVEVDSEGNTIPNNQTENYKLFAGGKIEVLYCGKKIEKEILTSDLVVKYPEYLDLQGQYPVIFIDFKGCKGRNFEVVKLKLNKIITDTLKNFSYLSLSKKTFKGSTIGQEYSELLSITKSGNSKKAIKDLSSLLYSYHDKEVWILIDEYDAAANLAYLEFSDEDAKAVSDLFSDVLEPALKGNSSLEKGVMTGVQYIVQSGMLSGLNNLSKNNITSTIYSRYYGIDQKEMNLLLNHFNVDEQNALKIKKWYNGYKSNIGSAENPDFIDKYNIWSVVNYLNKQTDGFKPYWEKSGSVDGFLQNLFKNKSFKETIENLVNGKSILIDQNKEDFNINDFRELKAIRHSVGNIDIEKDGLSLFYSYLFITGYLTMNESGQFQLPNKEIQIEMRNYLKEYYKKIFNIPTESLDNLTLALEQIFYKDNKEVSNIFIKDFGPKLSDVVKNLKVYNNENDALTDNGLFANESLMHSLLVKVCSKE